MFRLALLVLILSGCTAKSVVTPVASISNPAKTWRESFPTGKADQSAGLYQALKSAVTPEKIQGALRLRAFDLSCVLKSETEKYECSFQTNPDRGKKLRVGSAESEKLALLLFGLPVSQGDSGASTRFVECIHFDPQGKSQPTCTVAIELDYVGP